MPSLVKDERGCTEMTATISTITVTLLSDNAGFGGAEIATSVRKKNGQVRYMDKIGVKKKKKSQFGEAIGMGA